MDQQTEKTSLIEMLGTHFEAHYKLPPLAGKILGTLILDGCGSGITFEELVDRMKASRSSVSTSLNLLLKIDKITYYTVAGDRRKFFKPAPFSERLNNYIKLLNSERKIHERMMAYREKTISCPEEQCNLENAREYKRYILEMEQLLQNAVDRFRQIEKNNS